MAFGRQVDSERARFCEHCGSPLPLEGAFCASCGSAVPTQTLSPLPVEQASGATRPRATGRWALAFRKAAALALSALVLAAIGLYPLWWAPIAEKFADEAPESIQASDWLTEGPTDAPALQTAPLWTTVSAIAANPDAYAGRMVILSGVPAAVEVRDGATLALLAEGDASLVVGYPDATTAMAVGEEGTIAGAMSPDGDEMLVFAASGGVAGDPTASRSLTHLTLAASVAFLLAAVLLRVRRGRARRSSAVLVAGALAALIALGGCDITITTTVQPDGSGAVRTRVVTGEESMTELMDLPNAQAFTDSWLATAERGGMRVERTIDQLKVDREFASADEFAEGDSASTGSWSRLGQVSLPDGTHTYFLASFDTSSLYPEQPPQGEDTSAYDSLLEELDASTLRYVLELPGAPAGSNSPDGTAWDVPMGARTFMFAESVSAFGETGNRSAAINRIWAEILRWWFALSAALFTWTLVAYPWRKKGASRA